MNPYQEQILEHYKSPLNYGQPDWQPTYTFTLVNLSCGDEITVFLLIEDSKVIDFRFTARGCSISVASTSLLSQKLIGMKISEVEKLTLQSILDLIGIELTITRRKCAYLGLQAVKEALQSDN